MKQLQAGYCSIIHLKAINNEESNEKLGLLTLVVVLTYKHVTSDQINNSSLLHLLSSKSSKASK